MSGRDTTRRWSWAVTRTRRWQSVRHAVLERDGWACTQCGARRRLEVHHVQSVRNAPALGFDPGNCTTLCAPCHTIETNRELGNTPDPERAAWRTLLRDMQPNPETEDLHHA